MAVEEKELVQVTREEMVQKALEVERLEAALKQMKAEMKEWVDANGPLHAGDKVWDYQTSVSWEFSSVNMKEVCQLIALEAKNPWEFLSLPAAAIKKLEWDEKTLIQYGKRKETRKFWYRKEK